MADNNETEAEEVIGCYKVNAVKCLCGLLIHDHSTQEGVKNASIETCMESSRALTDPVESFTNVTTCLRFLIEFHHLNLTPPGGPIPSIQSHL